jgi:predicted nucleic acid-binding Zn ribbon protein
MWEAAVGPAIARNATPVALEGTTLVLQVADPRWTGELSRRSDELLARVKLHLTNTEIQRLVFRAG